MIVIQNKYVGYVIAMLVLFNCTKPIDFNQADALVLEPIVESSLIFYNASAADFFVGGSEQSTVEDFAEIDFFGNGFFQDSLEKIDFVFQVENSINRGYRLRVTFLDDNGQLLETFDIVTEASPNNQVIATEHIITFEGDALDSIKQTQIAEFSLTMLAGVPINENTPGEIDVKSKAVLFLNINL